MTHTAKMMGAAIGQEVNVRSEGWIIPMLVVDVKSAWGAVRLLVCPLRGSGEAWVDLSRCVRTTETSMEVART
jgi:hypothetical protein